MRLLCQKIAQRANEEDGEDGKFWQSRFRVVRLLDAEAILACAADVDLNPIRAAMAETLEASDFTSIQRRLEALLAGAETEAAQPGEGECLKEIPPRPSKSGVTPEVVPKIFERLRIRPEVWCKLVSEFGRMFSVVAGQPHRIDEHRSRIGR